MDLGVELVYGLPPKIPVFKTTFFDSRLISSTLREGSHFLGKWSIHVFSLRDNLYKPQHFCQPTYWSSSLLVTLTSRGTCKTWYCFLYFSGTHLHCPSRSEVLNLRTGYTLSNFVPVGCWDKRPSWDFVQNRASRIAAYRPKYSVYILWQCHKQPTASLCMVMEPGNQYCLSFGRFRHSLCYRLSPHSPLISMEM